MGLSLKPLSDRVVIEAAAAEEKSSGGIILPDTAQDRRGTLVIFIASNPQVPLLRSRIFFKRFG